MSYNDKIIKRLQERPMSMEELHEQLKKEGSYNKSLRTLQRQLEQLVEGDIVQAHAIRRSIIYSVNTADKSIAQDYFISKAWAELFELQKEWDADRLERFVMLFPEAFRKTVAPTLERAKSIRGDIPISQKTSVYNEVCGKIADFLRAADKKRERKP